MEKMVDIGAKKLVQDALIVMPKRKTNPIFLVGHHIVSTMGNPLKL